MGKFIKNNWEYIGGSLFLIAAIIIFFTFHKNPDKSKYTYQKQIKFISSGSYKPAVTGNYQFIITLGSNTCHACLVNINDYIQALQKRNINFSLVFLSHNRSENLRLAKIMNWENFPISTLKKAAELTDKRSRLIMINKKDSIISISNISSGKIHSMQYKNSVIDEHILRQTKK